MVNKIIGGAIAIGSFFFAANVAKIGGDWVGKMVGAIIQSTLTGKSAEVSKLIVAATATVAFGSVVIAVLIVLVSFAVGLHFFSKED